MKKTQYKVLKINIREFIIKEEKISSIIPITLTDQDKEKFYIEQDSTDVFRQLERLRGFQIQKIEEIIFLEAKHNKKQHELQENIFNNGIEINGSKYFRFGKSNSQAKDGVTVFMREDVYEEMNVISHLELDVKETVISKYESYRNLIFSSSTAIPERLPYIVIVDEFTKIIPNQFIRYVVREDAEFKDEEENVKKYEKRKIEEGYRDLEISPFDGCGCHSSEIGKVWNKYLLQPYTPASIQCRLPFIKGLSVEAEFKLWFSERGIIEIKDVFGKMHKVEDIDCLWNTSMWKGFKYFKSEYGEKAWDVYVRMLEKYEYKMGVSKYSHHTSHVDLKRRFNFQYLQTLDLTNPKYVDKFKSKDYDYDILDAKNDGKMIELAKYSTDMFEKIVKGDKFYSLKFLGLTDSEKAQPIAKYLQAVLINDAMLKDPMVRRLLKNTTKKAVNEMKFGKIYVDGFYHTIVGDMIAYFEHCAGMEVKGCLDGWNVYLDTVDKDRATLFRSPCVCSSEVSNVKIDKNNEVAKKYFPSWANQDIIMFSANDILMPQLGGA